MGLSSISEIDYVILLCRDMDRTRAFYQDVMKFELVEDHDDWAKFKVGSRFLTLRPRGQWLSWQDGDAVEGAAAVQLAFRVAPEEVNTCYTELVERGIDILDPPKDQEFGHRTMFLRDPEGNIVEIYAEL